MLVNLNEILLPARENKYAVGLFNTVNLEMARGVLQAAEELRAPVIIGTAEILLPYASLEDLSGLIIPMAKRAKVPVTVHYDHGLTYEKCIEALKLGFSSIMYDCSTDTYEENIRKVREITKVAHCFHATVEAELGHVGDNDGEDKMEDPAVFYTEPLQAKEFVEETGVDALAVAVGTAHGTYKWKPRLDFGRIAEIRKMVSVPLVLHGGSGLSEEDFHRAIQEGISKINIFTDINMAAAAAVKTGLEEGKNAMTDLMPYEIQAIKEATKEKMILFGSDGKA